MVLPAKRKIESLCPFSPSKRQTKTNTFEQITGLLTEVTELELAQLQALLAVRRKFTPSVNNSDFDKGNKQSCLAEHGYTVPSDKRPTAFAPVPVSVSDVEKRMLIRNDGSNNGITLIDAVSDDFDPSRRGREFEDSNSVIQSAEQLSEHGEPQQAIVQEADDIDLSVPLGKLNTTTIHSPSSAQCKKFHPDYMMLQVALHRAYTAKHVENAKTIWQLSDSGIVGGFVLARMRWDLRKFASRIENYTSLSTASVGEAAYMHSIRTKALVECRLLARHCGGLSRLAARTDDCFTFFVFCRSVFRFTLVEIQQMREPNEWLQPLPKFDQQIAHDTVDGSDGREHSAPVLTGLGAEDDREWNGKDLNIVVMQNPRKEGAAGMKETRRENIEPQICGQHDIAIREVALEFSSWETKGNGVAIRDEKVGCPSFDFDDSLPEATSSGRECSKVVGKRTCSAYERRKAKMDEVLVTKEGRSSSSGYGAGEKIRKPRNDESILANPVEAIQVCQFVQQVLRNRLTRCGTSNNPHFTAYQDAQRELKKLQRTELVKSIWKVQCTNFVGRYLLTTMTWRIESLSTEMKSRWDSQNTNEPAILRREAESVLSLYAIAVENCTRLAKRCGGLSALRNRRDACCGYIDLCDAYFQFTVEQTEEMKKADDCFEYVPSFISNAAHVANRAESQAIWKHPDPALIAKSLVLKAKYELEEEAAGNKKLKRQGMTPRRFFGHEFQMMDAKQVRVFRDRVMRNCGKLAKLCGGIPRLRDRADECCDYVKMATATYRLTQEELYDACARGFGVDDCRSEQGLAALKKAKKELEHAKRDLSRAKEGVKGMKLWNCPYISRVGTVLLCRARVQAAVQKLRRRHAAMERRFVGDDAFLDHDKQVMRLCEIERQRRRTFIQCWSLAGRCGGLSDLFKRGDDCARYVRHCMENFKFTFDELDMNGMTERGLEIGGTIARHGGKWFEIEYHALRAIELQICEMRRIQNCKTEWEISDMGLIGRKILKEEEILKAEQIYRKKKLIDLGMKKEILKDKWIDFKLDILSTEEILKHRDQVVENCGRLSGLCGGLAKLLARGDECSEFIQMAIRTYHINSDETGEWV